MTSPLSKFALIVSLIVLPLGCQPQRPGNNPTPQEEPVPDSGMNRDSDRNNPDDARSQLQSGVDVQVGGGEGVNVQVDPNQPGSNVEVGGDEEQ